MWAAHDSDNHANGLVELLAVGLGYRPVGHGRDLSWQERLRIRRDVYRGRPIDGERSRRYAVVAAEGVVQGDRVLGPRAYRFVLGFFGVIIMFAAVVTFASADLQAAVIFGAIGVPVLWLARIYPRLHGRARAVLDADWEGIGQRESEAPWPKVPWRVRVAGTALVWTLSVLSCWVLIEAVHVFDESPSTSGLAFGLGLGTAEVVGTQALLALHHRRARNAKG